jgi:hypothetical protein
MPMSHEPRLTLITNENIGLFAQAKNWLAKVWGKLSSAPARFWQWIKKTLHLQPAVDGVTSAAKWCWAVVQKAAGHFGWTGAAASGMLVVSTKAGRKTFGFLIGRPLRWLGGLVRSAWFWTENFLADHLGSPGTWVSARMSDFDNWLLPADPKSKKLGVIGTIKAFWAKHIASHMMLDNTLMRVVRVIGTILFGTLLIDGLALIGLGGALVATQWVLGLGIMASVCWQGYFLGEHVGRIPSVRRYFANGKTRVSFTGKPGLNTT